MSRGWGRLLAVAIAGASASTAASGADAPTKAKSRPVLESSVYRWTGFYLGGHLGEGFGRLYGGGAPVGVFPVLPGTQTQGIIGGYQLGYNVQLANNVVLGAEADITFGSLGGMPHDRSLGLNQYVSDFSWFGTVRGRAGQAFGRFLPYVTGGVAWGRNKLSIATPDDDEAGLFRTHWGWTVGFGLEYAVDGHWSLKGEYLYADFNSRTYGRLFFGDAADSLVPFRPSVSAFKLGMNYRWQDGELPRAAAGKGMVLKAPSAVGRRRLEHSRPDHLHRAGILQVHLALRGRAQPLRR